MWRKTLNKRAIISLVILPMLLWFVAIGGTAVPTLAQEPTPPLSAQETLPWSIHLYAVPASPPTGKGLFAFTGRTTNICQNGKVTFNATLIGSPTPFEGEYDPSEGNYTGFLDGFFPDGIDTYKATLRVVCLLPNGDRLETDTIDFLRYPYRNDSSPQVEILSEDGQAQLILNPDSLDAAHSIIVMDTNALPASLPSDVKQVWLPYSFRASGGTTQSDKAMILNLYDFLEATNPLTLRIFEWDAAAEQWLNNGSQSLSAPITGGQPNVIKPATKFTTYVLGSTPLWYDDFTSSAGVETDENVTRISALDFIKLDSNASSGFAISKPYTPTLPLDSWVEVSYDATIPVSTALTVSLLSLTDEVLIDEVVPPHSLVEIDPQKYPSLKLRVDMSTTSVGTTPHLSEWSILVKPVSHDIYLPLVIK